MKSLIRSFVYYFLGLQLAINYLPGIKVQGGWQTLLSAAATLTIFNLLVKPILKLLFLPINLLTLGMFRWLINVIILYLLMMVVPEIKIIGFVNAVLVSFFLSFVWSLLRWLR